MDEENVQIIIITRITFVFVTSDLYRNGLVTAKYLSTEITQMVT